jgi:hypothetical protein
MKEDSIRTFLSDELEALGEEFLKNHLILGAVNRSKYHTTILLTKSYQCDPLTFTK